MSKLSFDDVLIEPTFSTINSRKDVSLSQNFLGLDLKLPIISSNMDTITESRMAIEMARNGAVGALHRFLPTSENIVQFSNANDVIFNSDSKNSPIVSVGLDDKEYERAMHLSDTGANIFLIDVAHGASLQVVKRYNLLRSRLPATAKIIVGNFANSTSLREFLKHTTKDPDAVKAGIGGGSMCTTRLVTGCGVPTLTSVIDCATVGIPVIADGGIRTSGDIAKALAAGASAVMLGQMLSGTTETPGEIVEDYTYEFTGFKPSRYKKYRGSASKESYEVQGKNNHYISPEGESTLVPYKGPVAGVLQQIEGGLRSAFSYVGANNLQEFRENAKLVQITAHGVAEGKAHGKQL